MLITITQLCPVHLFHKPMLANPIITFFVGAIPLVAATTESFVSEMLQEINRERQRDGQTKVCLDPDLMNIAQDYADRQALYQKGDHMAGGQHPSQRAANYGEAAENLYSGYNRDGASRAEIANGALMADPPHRANIINGRYTHVGVGRASIIKDGDTFYYWVQFFARIENASCQPDDPMNGVEATKPVADTNGDTAVIIEEPISGAKEMSMVERVAGPHPGLQKIVRKRIVKKSQQPNGKRYKIINPSSGEPIADVGDVNYRQLQQPEVRKIFVV